MPLPHYTQVKTTNGGQSVGGPGTSVDEVLYTNLFEIAFTLPTILTTAPSAYDPILLLENATKVSFQNLTQFDIQTKEQRFKYSTRQFLTTPAKTSGEIVIPFQVNVDDTGQMNTWLTLKAWYDLVFNNANGTLHYKADIIGNIIVNQHDKKGVVLRRVTFINCQISKLTGWDLDWASNDIVQAVDATFIYDYFVDEYFDIDKAPTVTTPVVTGYAPGT
jgi:hypothetical protein